MEIDITVDGGGHLLRSSTLLLCRGIRKRSSFVLIWLAKLKILDGPKHDFFYHGTERTAMNSLVPFRPVAQGRIELGHALTETNRRIDHRNRINLAFGCPYRIAVDSHSLPTTNAHWQVLFRPGRTSQPVRAPNQRGHSEEGQRLRQRGRLQVGPSKPEGAGTPRLNQPLFSPSIIFIVVCHSP